MPTPTLQTQQWEDAPVQRVRQGAVRLASQGQTRQWGG